MIMLLNIMFYCAIISVCTSYQIRYLKVSKHQQKSISTCIKNYHSPLQLNDANSASLPIETKSDNKMDKLKKLNNIIHIVSSVVYLRFLDNYGKKTYESMSMTFLPASLNSMIIMFSFLIITSKFNSNLSDEFANFYIPALSFFRLWLSLFFIPPLIVIPLKLGLIAGNEFKLLFVILFGLVISLFSTGKISSLFNQKSSPNKNEPITLPTSVPMTLPSPVLPLIASMITLGLTSKFKSNLLIKIFGIQSTITSFLIANKWSSNKIKKYIHPVLICSFLAMLMQKLLSLVVNIPFNDVLNLYYGSPLRNGAGDLISGMLGPAIVSFGVQLYQYRQLIQNNLFNVILTTLLGSFIGLFSSSLLSKLVNIKSYPIASSTLTRCITSPLALAGATITGADPTLSALIVVLTGLFGAAFGQKLLDIMKIEDPISVGLAMGSSAHGLGASSLTNEPEKFSAAIVSMTLTGLFTVILLSIEPIRKLL